MSSSKEEAGRQPLHQMSRFLKEWRELFDTFHPPPTAVSRPGPVPLWGPPVNLYRKGDALIVEAAMPGMKKEEIEVHCTEDTLTLEGDRRLPSYREADEFLRYELREGRFSRVLPLPYPVNPDRVTAEYREGILVVTCPLKEPGRFPSRQVDIE